MTSVNGELRNLLSKIKFTSKFSNLSLSTNTEKDGSTVDDTLIHNAFVKYFETKNERFPEWLGETKRQNANNQAQRGNTQPTNNYSNSQYQPVYTNRNSGPHQGTHQYLQHSLQNYQQQQQQQGQQQQGQQQQNQQAYQQQEQLPPPQPSYTPRSSSRLQDMYNKSRHQSIPGSGYNSQPVQSAPTLGRTNTGGRLREKMLNSNYQSSPSNSRPNSGGNSAGSGSTRATWGSR